MSSLELAVIDTSIQKRSLASLASKVQQMRSMLDAWFTAPRWILLTLGQILAIPVHLHWLFKYREFQQVIDECVLSFREVRLIDGDKDEAYRICAAAAEICDQMSVLEIIMLESEFHRILVFRGRYLRWQRAREALEDIREAHLLALDSGFDEMINSTLDEIGRQIDEEVKAT